MALDGWNWEDAVYKADDGIHINWPNKYRRTGWWAEPGESSADDRYEKLRQQLYEFVAEAEAYCKTDKPEATNLKFEALRGVFAEKQRVYFHAHMAPEINDIIDFVRAFKIKYPVIVGGNDAPLVADRLKENGFSIIVKRIYSLPDFDEDITFSKYELPYRLQEAGLLFCLDVSGDQEATTSRNLPFLAGTAWAYGLTEEQAVACISLNAAKILGVDDRLGSLEAGKDATLFVSDGNALDMMSNNVTLAMIRGNFISLDNQQKQLSNKYHKRYGLE
jgi:imidazolonepropionase-like amidohydrolase